jgi:hypothetical protein
VGKAESPRHQLAGIEGKQANHNSRAGSATNAARNGYCA